MKNAKADLHAQRYANCLILLACGPSTAMGICLCLLFFSADTDMVPCNGSFLVSFCRVYPHHSQTISPLVSVFWIHVSTGDTGVHTCRSVMPESLHHLGQFLFSSLQNVYVCIWSWHSRVDATLYWCPVWEVWKRPWTYSRFHRPHNGSVRRLRTMTAGGSGRTVYRPCTVPSRTCPCASAGCTGLSPLRLRRTYPTLRPSRQTRRCLLQREEEILKPIFAWWTLHAVAEMCTPAKRKTNLLIRGGCGILPGKLVPKENCSGPRSIRITFFPADSCELRSDFSSTFCIMKMEKIFLVWIVHGWTKICSNCAGFPYQAETLILLHMSLLKKNHEHDAELILQKTRGTISGL